MSDVEGAISTTRAAEGYLQDESSYYEQSWRLDTNASGRRVVGVDTFNELFWGLEGRRVRVTVEVLGEED